MSGSKHRGHFCGGPGLSSPEKFCDCICKILQYGAFCRKMVSSAVHNALSNTLAMRSGSFPTMGTAFHLEMFLAGMAYLTQVSGYVSKSTLAS